jgi:uncharacterized OB-fold protein
MTEAVAAAPKPVPEPDEASRPFFDGAASGALMIQQCSDCQAFLAPGTALCTECLSESLDWVKASGRGTIFTFGVMHQLYHPGFAPEIPYVIAVVQLEEGPRLNTNIVGPDARQIAVGDPVEAVFEQVAEGVWLPKFRTTRRD